MDVENGSIPYRARSGRRVYTYTADRFPHPCGHGAYSSCPAFRRSGCQACRCRITRGVVPLCQTSAPQDPEDQGVG